MGTQSDRAATASQKTRRRTKQDRRKARVRLPGDNVECLKVTLAYWRAAVYFRVASIVECSGVTE